MDIIEWIEYIDKCLKFQVLEKPNPYPHIFYSSVEYKFFLEDQLNVVPVLKNIHKKIIEKYPSITRGILELYILTSYFLCLKFYSDTLLTFPIKSIRYILDRKYSVKNIRLVEIDILEIIDYTFPITL